MTSNRQALQLEPQYAELLPKTMRPAALFGLFAMMPNVDDAHTVERGLLASGFGGDDIMLLKTEDVLDKVVPTALHHGEVFPSVGTESATVLKYRELAQQGHCAVMICAASGDATEKAMQSVRTVPFSIAEKYRFLVIEDLH